MMQRMVMRSIAFSFLILSAARATDLLLDTTCVPVRAGCQQKCPAIGFDGTNFLVVWHDGRNQGLFDIYGTRWSPDGTALGRSGFRISEGRDDETQPAVAFDGTNYLVVWQEEQGNNWDIWGRFVTPQGKVAGKSFAVGQSAGNQTLPAISFDGTNYFVVWQDDRDGINSIYGTRASTSGTILDGDGRPVASDSTGKTSPAVAFDGTNFFVVYGDSLLGGDIWGMRVGQDGYVVDRSPVRITSAPGDQASPAVAFAFGNYFVAWGDQRTETTKLYGARVTPHRIVLDPDGVPVDTSQWWEGAAAVTADSSDYVVVWHRKPGPGQA